MSTICVECNGTGELDTFDYASGVKTGTRVCLFCDGAGEIPDPLFRRPKR